MAKSTPPKSKTKSKLPARSTLRPTNVPRDHLIRMYEWMVRIRAAETRLMELLQDPRSQFHGTLHPARGQEAVTVGSVIHTTASDWLSPTPRELGVQLCRGLPMRELFTQFTAKNTQLGSMQLHTTPSLGSTASNLAVGAGIALANKLKKLKGIAIGFLGDGVMATGTFHEVINLVAAHRLPMVLIVNNNRMGFSQLVTETSPVVDLGSRAEAYGMPWSTVDGCDVEAVYDAVGKAVARARAGEGGTLVECTTVRLGGFTSDTPMLETIPKDAPDVLANLEERLLHLDVMTASQIKVTQVGARKEVADAEANARPSVGKSGGAMTMGRG